MPTSQSMRNMYPELIVGGVTSKWKVARAIPKCDYSSAIGVKFLASEPIGGFIVLKFHPAVVNWGQALAAVMFHHNYQFREMSGGTLSCRKIAGSTKTSLHAHGVAVDFNPSKNPFTWRLITDMPKELITDITKNIVTVDNYPITSWGGNWFRRKDPMHFQPSQVSRTQLEKGIDFSKVPGWGNYLAWGNGEQMISIGDKGNAVAKIQKALNGWRPSLKLVPDGKFGPITRNAVMSYQSAADITSTGAVDGVTMALLMEYVPDWIDNHTPPAPPSGIQPGDKVRITGRDVTITGTIKGA